jgi:hypothetical protein
VTNRGHPERRQIESKLDQITLGLSANAWTVVSRRTKKDLLKELVGNQVEFVNTQYEHRYVTEISAKRIALEYINNRWYYLEFDQQSGNYLTKETLALTKSQLEQHQLTCTLSPPKFNILTL